MTDLLLVLWDIDHTLIETGGIGTEVFRAAFKAATGKNLANPPDSTGKLEPALFDAACHQNDVQFTDDHHRIRLFNAFAAAQEAEYRRRTADLTQDGGVLPGVHEVLTALAGMDEVVQTVLSGNTQQAGTAKLEIFHLDTLMHLNCAVWGEDAATRPALVPVAWDKAHTYGSLPGPANTVVIGDTPADVDAALKNGCRVVAVATGKTTEKELAEAGAKVTLPSLSDTAAAVTAILGSWRPGQ